MRYRIEFLREWTEEESVCHTRSLRARDLQVVQAQAQAWSATARRKFGAGAFQIRDLDKKGLIVAVEAIDGPAPSIH
jgi:hypothetical protein